MLYTTPISAGCLEGMTRKHIIELAKENDINFVEKNIKLGNLIKSDEIFIASSLKLIVPVASITTKETHRYKTGPVTKKLKRLLWKHVI